MSWKIFYSHTSLWKGSRTCLEKYIVFLFQTLFFMKMRYNIRYLWQKSKIKERRLFFFFFETHFSFLYFSSISSYGNYNYFFFYLFFIISISSTVLSDYTQFSFKKTKQKNNTEWVSPFRIRVFLIYTGRVVWNKKKKNFFYF